MKRQQRKLNFLITQTELYAHFMSRKLTGETDADKEAILRHLDENTRSKQHEVKGGIVQDWLSDDYSKCKINTRREQLIGCDIKVINHFHIMTFVLALGWAKGRGGEVMACGGSQ